MFSSYYPAFRIFLRDSVLSADAIEKRVSESLLIPPVSEAGAMQSIHRCLPGTMSLKTSPVPLS